MFEPEVPALAIVPPSERAPSKRDARSGSASTTGEVVPASLAVEVFTTVRDARAIVDEWDALYDESRSRNPFSDPTWALAWAEHFVADGDLFVVAVRDRGELCCVAPFYRRRIGRGRATFARSLQLVGAVEHVVLTERPQILVRGGQDRRALRRVLEVIQADTGWDWVEVSLAAEQGWFEPNWIDRSSPARPYVVHKTSRPSVGIELPADVEALRAGMKRNLRESLRRARNRLNRTGAGWRIEAVSEPERIAAAIDDVMALHGARAAMAGTVSHADMFAEAADRSFVRDAVSRMADAGRAEALFLEVDGRRVAGLMTLLAPDAVYLCFSGVDPEWWSFSAVTLLQFEAACRAVATGRGYADLSVGVDVAKLRWSETVSVHPEFVMVAGRKRSEIAFGTYFLAAAAARAVRERSRFRGPSGAE